MTEERPLPHEDTTPGHTRGPWVLCHDGDYDEATNTEFRWPWEILGANDEIVVNFTGGGDVTEADARLISSAPDLLAALRLHVSKSGHTQGCTQSPVFGCSPRCKQTRATIARATGSEERL